VDNAVVDISRDRVPGCTVPDVETDVLGQAYRRRVIELPDDDEGRVVATLVSRPASQPTGRAVLYVHGFIDYFFQTHLADFYVERGWDFYALDLRKYGRSLLPHQTPNYCASLTDYQPELDAAAKIIRDEDGHGTMLVNGHSTGGLIAALWAHARRDDGLVDGMFLNSPFLDLNAPWTSRHLIAPAVGQLAKVSPYRKLPFSLGEVYGRSIHADHRGEWSYDLAWKPLAGFPVTAGWLSAVRTGQLRLHAGLSIPVPILVACSARSSRGTRWSDDALSSDTVLDVDQIARWSPRLGRHVTIVRVDQGLHDLVLSAPQARERTFAELDRWMSAYLP
jgi:alpha-beta hydrolase superfamily lysophospholipase